MVEIIHFSNGKHKIAEEEEYKPSGQNRLFVYGSDESISNYGHEPYTLPPAFQPMPNFGHYTSNEFLFGGSSSHLNYRRHSSYSHEDILRLKYQNPPVDPRYRDSRPFIQSSSNIYDNARRDFMSRRRSSSSLQDDILRPFQQIQLNEYLRKSSPSINRTRSNSPATQSDKSNSNSNWNLNPSILIEEYNDNQCEVKSNNSSSNLSQTNVEINQQPSMYLAQSQPQQTMPNEDDVLPFASLDGDIPFIDDENITTVQNPIQSEPIVNDYLEKALSDENIPPEPPEIPQYIYSKVGRKTVSFDLMDSTEELNKLRRTNVLNKSNTCDHITNIKLNKMNCNQSTGTKVNVMYSSDAPKSTSAPSWNDDEQSRSDFDEPIFKLCTFKQVKAEENESLKTTKSVENDNYSMYLDDSDVAECRRQNFNAPLSRVDSKLMTLDLTDLRSDSTNSTNSQSDVIVSNVVTTKEHKNQQHSKINSKFAYIAAWKPPKFFDKLQFGHGKVQALKNYFEQMKFSTENHKVTTQSTPDLTHSDKLTANEREKVLTELREWSEFGTAKSMSTKKMQNFATKATSTICANPITRSVFNLTVTTTFNDDTTMTSSTTKLSDASRRSTSEPDVCQRKKFPEAYIVRRRQKVTTNISSTKSCPNLNATKVSPTLTTRKLHDKSKAFIINSKLKANIYNSPCHRSNFTTLRQIKKNQKTNKLNKCCRHRDACVTDDVNRTDGSDEPR